MIPIILNSEDRDSGTTHDFTIRFTPEIQLDRNERYVVAVDKFESSYSWHNLSSKYNNHQLKYSIDSGTNYTTITIPDGNYDYSNLNSLIKQAITSNGHSSDLFNLRFVTSRLKTYLTLGSNFRLDLTNGEFASLIGFNKRIVSTSGYSDKVPDITRSVDSIDVRSNIVSNSIVSGKNTNVLMQIPVYDLRISYPFVISNRRLLYNSLSINGISEIRIYLTDTLGRPIDLNGQQVHITLLISKLNLLN